MMRKRAAFVLSLVLLLQLLTACGGSPAGNSAAVDPTPEPGRSETNPPAPSAGPEPSREPQPAAAPITVTDQAGREITLEAPAETIVSCYYLVSASLLTLGQKDKIVGIEQKVDTRELYKLCAPEFLDLPQVGSGKETNIEAIAALEPDLVILSIKQKEAAETLTGLGISTALVEPETYEAFNELLEMLGKLCGCEDAAHDLIAYYDGVVQRVTSLTADVERPSVYLSGEATYLRTCAGGMYQREMIEMAGGSSVSAEIEGMTWMDISAEQLAAWNPEVIFAVQYAAYTLDDIRGDAALAGVKAVAENSLYTIPSEIEAWDYPQPSSVLGLLWMAHILHPELVSEEDYINEAEIFYRTYFGLDVTKAQLGIE